jgi:ribonuclease HII
VGPLVVGAVVVKEGFEEDLGSIGVKDSKLLTPKRRSILYDEIRARAKGWMALRISPVEIDAYVSKGKKYRKLNYLEAIYMARLINELKPDKVFVDAPDTNPLRFAKDLQEILGFKCNIISEHRADSKYAVVSAASIIAKVERDRAVDRLRRRHGDFGSGYPSDPITVGFLRDWLEKKGSKPDFTRKSWKTWGRMAQQTL